MHRVRVQEGKGLSWGEGKELNLEGGLSNLHVDITSLQLRGAQDRGLLAKRMVWEMFTQ